MSHGLTLAVFVSGEGTTLDSLATALGAGSVAATIRLVVADREGVPALAVAGRHGIPSAVVSVRGVNADVLGRRLDEVLPPGSVDLLVLAGFRSILPSGWLAGWRGRAINVHPSLLPRHGGLGQFGPRVYASILEAHELESGATVHVVTEDVDRGPVLLQERFPVLASETVESLQAKTQVLERRLLREVVGRFADGRWALPYVPSETRAAPGGPRDPPS
jgi:phosphoribosylglycinamide formyltransferase 1